MVWTVRAMPGDYEHEGPWLEEAALGKGGSFCTSRNDSQSLGTQESWACSQQHAVPGLGAGSGPCLLPAVSGLFRCSGWKGGQDDPGQKVLEEGPKSPGFPLSL